MPRGRKPKKYPLKSWTKSILWKKYWRSRKSKKKKDDFFLVSGCELLFFLYFFFFYREIIRKLFGPSCLGVFFKSLLPIKKDISPYGKTINFYLITLIDLIFYQLNSKTELDMKRLLAAYFKTFKEDKIILIFFLILIKKQKQLPNHLQNKFFFYFCNCSNSFFKGEESLFFSSINLKAVNYLLRENLASRYIFNLYSFRKAKRQLCARYPERVKPPKIKTSPTYQSKEKKSFDYKEQNINLKFLTYPYFSTNLLKNKNRKSPVRSEFNPSSMEEKYNKSKTKKSSITVKNSLFINFLS